MPDGDGPFPTLVTRTIYGLPIAPLGGEPFDSRRTLPDRAADEDEDEDEDGDEDGDDDLDPAEALARGWPLITENGYALVIQNTRGRMGSGGVDRSWLDDRSDGYDLVEWVADQPWSNGRIGIFGDSGLGMTAALAAAAQPPSLDAVFLQAAPADPFGIDMAPEGGGMKVETLLLQGASLAFDVSPGHVAARGIAPAEVPEFVEAIGGYFGALAQGIEDPLSSEVWMAAPLGRSEELARLMPFWSLLADADVLAAYRTELDVRGDILVPTSIVSLWQDSFARSAVALHADLVERGVPTELLVVNGSHYEIDDPRIYPEPRMLSWFDHWLKDAPAPARADVELAVQGEADAFLRADAMADLVAPALVVHLTDDGGMEPRGDGAEGEVVFTSDPADPVPTLGGRNLLAAAGTQDHASLLGRPDIAVFRTAPSTVESWIAGPVVADLTVRTEAPSFDVSARLLEIAPDGTARLVLSHLARVAAASPGETRVTVELGQIVHRVAPGHALALLLAGSDFPAWDRNPQTGGDLFTSGEMRSATLGIVTGGAMPSALAIPLFTAN
ncbi:CocE/NonD family hydrolase [Roseicyclus sp.]|uniref:CocE/NonD family hydrolase n=1 Tax=Roseicyclus sp. TaxID=1914329 RepID=UPI003F9F23B8